MPISRFKLLFAVALFSLASPVFADSCEGVKEVIQKLKSSPDDVYSEHLRFLYDLDWKVKCASWKERLVEALRDELLAKESQRHYPLYRKVSCANLIRFLGANDEKDEMRFLEILDVPYRNARGRDSGLDRTGRRWAYVVLEHMKPKTLKTLQILAKQVSDTATHESALAVELLFKTLDANSNYLAEFRKTVDFEALTASILETKKKLDDAISRYEASDTAGSETRAETQRELRARLLAGITKAEVLLGCTILGTGKPTLPSTASDSGVKIQGDEVFTLPFLSNDDPQIVLAAIRGMQSPSRRLRGSTIEALAKLLRKQNAKWAEVRTAAIALLAIQAQLQVTHLLVQAEENPVLRRSLGECVLAIFKLDPDWEDAE